MNYGYGSAFPLVPAVPKLRFSQQLQLGSPLPHLQRDFAHHRASSAPGLGSPLSDARLLQDLFGQLMSGLCYLVRRLYSIRQQQYTVTAVTKGLPPADGRAAA